MTTAQRKASVTVCQVSLENSATGVYTASMHSRMAAAHVSAGVPYVPCKTCPVTFLGVRITSVNFTFLLSTVGLYTWFLFLTSLRGQAGTLVLAPNLLVI